MLRATTSARYAYFVKHVADTELVWALKNSAGWVMAGDADGKKFLPVWPQQAYAQLMAKDEWADAQPTEIDLAAWCERWLPGLERDGHRVAVFMVPSDSTTGCISPSALLNDLERELENY